MLEYNRIDHGASLRLGTSRSTIHCVHCPCILLHALICKQSTKCDVRVIHYRCFINDAILSAIVTPTFVQKCTTNKNKIQTHIYIPKRFTFVTAKLSIIHSLYEDLTYCVGAASKHRKSHFNYNLPFKLNYDRDLRHL